MIYDQFISKEGNFAIFGSFFVLCFSRLAPMGSTASIYLTYLKIRNKFSNNFSIDVMIYIIIIGNVIVLSIPVLCISMILIYQFCDCESKWRYIRKWRHKSRHKSRSKSRSTSKSRNKSRSKSRSKEHNNNNTNVYDDELDFKKARSNSMTPPPQRKKTNEKKHIGEQNQMNKMNKMNGINNISNKNNNIDIDVNLELEEMQIEGEGHVPPDEMEGVVRRSAQNEGDHELPRSENLVITHQ